MKSLGKLLAPFYFWALAPRFKCKHPPRPKKAQDRKGRGKSRLMPAIALTAAQRRCRLAFAVVKPCAPLPVECSLANVSRAFFVTVPTISKRRAAKRHQVILRINGLAGAAVQGCALERQLAAAEAPKPSQGRPARPPSS